jgi:hypothetical protein
MRPVKQQGQLFLNILLHQFTLMRTMNRLLMNIIIEFEVEPESLEKFTKVLDKELQKSQLRL